MSKEKVLEVRDLIKAKLVYNHAPPRDSEEEKVQKKLLSKAFNKIQKYNFC